MDTPRYRIGNDLTILWAINNRDGSPYNLEGKEVHLFVTNKRGRQEAPITLSTLEDGTINNVVRWDFRGEEQRVLGEYTLTVEILNTADSKEIKRDKCEAFTLVGTSSCETEQEGEANILDGGDLILATKLDIYRFGIPKIEIGPNGNWFIDGVDTGFASGGGSSMISKIYTEDDFGKTFDKGATIDTFNAYAINSLFERLNNLSIPDSGETIDIVESWEQIDESEKQALSALLGRALKELIEAVEKRVKSLEDEPQYWQEDEQGNIWTDRNVYSTKQISAGGVGEEGTSNGNTTYSLLTDWGDWDTEDEDLTKALGANLGYWLYTKIQSINTEDTGVSEEFVTSYVTTQINALINGAPEAYDTLKEIADILEGNVNNINDLLTAIATKASKEELKAVDEKYAEEVAGLKNADDSITDRLDALESYWTLEDGILKTAFDVYSEKQVSSGGIAEEGEGGSDVLLLEDWDNYNASLSQALSAKLGVELEDRVTAIEQGSISPDLSGYATTTYVNTKIASVNSTIDSEIAEVNEALDAALASINTALNTKADKTALEALSNELADEVAALVQADEAINNSIATIESEIAALQEVDETLDNRLSKIEGYWQEDANGNLYTKKNVYSYAQVSAMGLGTEGDGTSTGGGLERASFDIATGTTTITLTHGLATKDVIVSIYENNTAYQQVLADIYIEDENNVRIVFGSATDVAHRAVIIG